MINFFEKFHLFQLLTNQLFVDYHGDVKYVQNCSAICHKNGKYLPELDDSKFIKTKIEKIRIESKLNGKVPEEVIPSKLNYYIGASFDFEKKKWIYNRSKKEIKTFEWRYDNDGGPTYPLMNDIVVAISKTV